MLEMAFYLPWIFFFFIGAVDWGFFVLVVGSLISLFPPEVLQQHILELRGGTLPPGQYPPNQYPS